MPVPSGYGFFNIEATIFCIACVSILLFKQLTVFNKDETQKIFTQIILIQLAYFVSMIIRVLVDTYELPHTFFTVSAISIINFGLYGFCGYKIFIYLELYQKSEYFLKVRDKIFYKVPFIFNMILLFTSPYFGAYFTINEEVQLVSGSLWQLMIFFNLSYPLAGLISFLWQNRNSFKNIHLAELQTTVTFPLIFITFGPISALQWRIPFLVYGLVLADLFVYVHYTDNLMRERNRALESEKELANAQNRAKSQFLSNMSHDIRTPMNAIIGFTNLAIANITKTEKVEEYLNKIQSSSNHLLSLINDVLEMSRIESGKIDLDETYCSLPEILHDLNTIIIGQIDAKQQELFMDALNVKHEHIFCDKLRLNQVLLNLLSNAIKYTPSDGKISVRVTEKDNAPEGYGAYEISVKDSGIGMSPEFAAKIFEAFTRERTSTVSKIQGTGLGMAITKRIVELMGGTIELFTEQGVGSEFIVRVNFRIEPGEEKIDMHITELDSIHALVVDDDFNICDSTTKMLAQMGLRADWTLSGKEAILRTKQALELNDKFELFMIDWRLRDLNGIDVARQIRQTVGENIPILLMTAYDWPTIRDEAVEAGVNGFCNKPIFISELHNTLQKIFNTPLQHEKTAPEEKTIDFSGRRLLLVDDVDVNREIATMLLEMNDFLVETAEDGDIAVEKVRNSEPGYYDAVLMDIQMPRMNGYDATRAIRLLENKKLANIPILAMTANAFDEDKQAALDAGMNDHIPKPIDMDKLLESLAKIFG